MRQQPRIAIAGVGAVGTLIAYRLVAGGCPVTLVARGQRADQLQGGLRVDDGPPLAACVVEARDVQPHDVVIIATKEGSLAAMLKEISHALRPETLVIPLVNGLPFWFDPAARAVTPRTGRGGGYPCDGAPGRDRPWHERWDGTTCSGSARRGERKGR